MEGDGVGLSEGGTLAGKAPLPDSVASCSDSEVQRPRTGPIQKYGFLNVPGIYPTHTEAQILYREQNQGLCSRVCNSKKS